MQNYLSKILLIQLFAFLVLISSCTKMDTRKPISGSGAKPSVVKVTNVLNFKGGATITYTLPKESDLLYVLAEYNISPTAKRQTKASIYNNEVTVGGFNNKGDYPVTLYAVTSSEVKSDPVVANVSPDTPAFRSTFLSIKYQRDFGGINVSFKNPLKANIAVVIITNNKNGQMAPAQTFYNSSDSGNFSARGFDTTTRRFGIYVRDEFNNYSDTLFINLNPLYETLLNKSKFQPYPLPTDQPVAYGWVMQNLWNNDLNAPGYHTPEGATMPIHFTFDMGVLTKLSRFKTWQRADGNLFAWGNPRKWIMWGSNNPDASGSFVGWTKLMECESIKPSGSPGGTNTADDVLYAMAGEDFTFPLSVPKVRYIRMQVLQNWSNGGFVHLNEITFWGDPR